MNFKNPLAECTRLGLEEVGCEQITRVKKAGISYDMQSMMSRVSFIDSYFILSDIRARCRVQNKLFCVHTSYTRQSTSFLVNKRHSPWSLFVNLNVNNIIVWRTYTKNETS